MLQVDAIKINQKNCPVYITAFLASDLINENVIKIDRYENNNQEGYQRELKRQRILAAAKYLTNEDGIYPTSVLLNSRKEVLFNTKKQIAGTIEFGTLTIPDQSYPLYVIDGQHRIESIREVIKERIEFQEYPIPVSLFNFKEPFDEMRMFYIVNSRQKGVPTSLVLHFLDRSIKTLGPAIEIFEPQQRVYAAKALDVVKILYTDQSSPWYGLVQTPNEKKQPYHIITERALADSIGIILKDSTPIDVDLIKSDPRRLAEPLIMYWTAIKEIFPEIYKNPSPYTLFRTTGVYSLHMIYDKIFSYCRPVDKLKYKDKMKFVLQKMFEAVFKETGFDREKFWDKKKGYPLAIGSSQKMIRALASLFLDHLPEE